jgi:hypothetical protein
LEARLLATDAADLHGTDSIAPPRAAVRRCS